MMHRYQIELTTRCNFDCWYCTGRAMPQTDMTWDQFTKIVDNIPRGSTVMLQGEGEPTLWPDWWRGVQYVVSKGLVPYSIINGSRVDVVMTALMFPRIGVSIDTLDPKAAEQIGRRNLKKVLDNTAQLAVAMPGRVLVHIVQAQHDTSAVIRWCIDREIGYVVQPLQQKHDYETVYPMWMRKPRGPASEPAKYECKYLTERSHHFWTVGGRELPCCYIKFEPQTFNLDNARHELAAGDVPRHCTGCRNLKKVADGTQPNSNGASHQNA